MRYSYESWDSIKHIIDPFFISHEVNLPPHKGNAEKMPRNCFPIENSNRYFYRISVDDKKFIDYEVNDLFFRSPNFNNIREGIPSAVYSGCSQSYGIGLSEQYTWPFLLTNKLKSKHLKEVDYYNLSVNGSSIFLVLKNLMAFIRLYGKPKYIFIVMPPIARDFKYDVKQKRFYSVLRGGAYWEGDYPKVFLDYVNQNYEDDILKAITEIKMFEDYCLEAKISLFWTYWYDFDSNIYKEFKFNNIVHMDQHVVKDNYDNWPYWEVAEDGLHYGSSWHKYVSETLYDKVKND